MAVVGEYLPHNFAYHLFQFADKLRRAVFAAINLAQLPLPASCQLGAFQQLLMNQVYQLYARRCGVERLALLADIVAAKERFDDRRTGGGASDAVLLERIAQFLVLDRASGCLHGAQQGGFRVGLGWLGELLCQLGAVRSALALGKSRQYAFSGFLPLVLRRCPRFGEDAAPSRFQDLLARGAERHFGGLPQYGSGGITAIRVENSDEAAGNQVVDVALHVGHGFGRNACRDDGMVVRHLRIVEYFFPLRQYGTAQGLQQLAVASCDAVEDTFAFRIKVFAEVSRIYARVSRIFFLVEALYELQSLVCGVAELLIAFHLQTCEVEEAGRGFRTVLAVDALDDKGCLADLFQRSKSLLLGGEGHAAVAAGPGRGLFVGFAGAFGAGRIGCEEGVAIARGQDPEWFGLKLLYLLLALHDKGQRRRLHAADGERRHAASAVAVLECVQAGGVHAQEPVADGPAQAGFVHPLVFILWLQVGKALAYAFFCQRRHPEALDGT